MDKIKLEELAVAYGGNEDLIQLYDEWGDSPFLKEVFEVLDAYQPEWNKEKELGSWAAEFILDLLEDKECELKELQPAARKELLQELVDERYEDFRCSHQFARMNNLMLRLQEEEELEAVLAEENERITFPVIR